MSDANRINELRRQLGIEGPRKGVIYAVNGSITDQNGRYYVQYQDRSTDRLKARGAFQAVAGVPVLTRFDPDTQQYVILGQDTSVQAGNTTTFTGNPLDERNRPPISSTSITDLLPRVVGNSTLALTVGPLAAPYYYRSDWYPFGGATIDLSAFVPGTANTHRVAVVGYYPPFARLYAMGSTPISTDIELGSQDIDEAWESRRRDLVPVARVRLTAGQTALTPADVKPLRQIVNAVPSVGYPNPVTDLLFIPPGRTLMVRSGFRIAAGGVVRVGGGGVLSVIA